jgi:diguanylate cyclase (GGDEF)-like protein/PAS domain S-box-containing protein
VTDDFDEAEWARIAALRALQVLDTPPDPALDNLVRAAAAMCEVPIALVSLVDVERQWFKARQGLEASETPRDVAFCAHAIKSDAPFEVRDALSDPRFASNPLVAGDPNIRFYHGVPLVGTGGHRYGTLCVIDRRPRVLTPEQRAAVQSLAQLALRLLESHRLTVLSSYHELILSRTLSALPDAVITCRSGQRQVELNAAATAWCGRPSGDLALDEWAAAYPLREPGATAALPHSAHPLVRACAGETVTDLELVFLAPDAAPRTVLCTASPLTTASGLTLGAVLVMRDVSALRASEASLRDERQRLATIIDGTNAGTWEWHIPSGRTRFNARWAEIVGYTLDELEPVSIETWMKLAHAGDLEASGRALTDHFEGRSDYYDFACRMQHKAGHWVWVHDRGRVFEWDAEGRPVWMSGTHIDISEHKESEQRLADAMQRLHEIVDASEDVSIIATDITGVIRIFSTGAEKLLGHRAEELVGRATPQVFHDATEVARRGERLTAALGRPVEGFEVFVANLGDGSDTNVWTYVRKDGERLQVRLSVSALHDGGGALAGYVGIAVDLTETLAAEERARLEAERFSAAFDSAALGFALVSLQGRWLDVNAAACEMFGRTRDELLALDFQSITHPEDRGRDLEALRDLLAGRRANYQVDKRYFRGDGGVLWARLAVSLVHGADRRPLYFVSQIQDVTAQRVAESRLREAQERTRTILESVGDAILTIDAQGTITYTNAAALRILGGASASELDGQRLQDVLELRGEDGRGESIDLTDLVSPTGAGIEGMPDLVLQAKGAQTPISIIKTILKRDDEHEGAVIVIHDTSAERERTLQADRLSRIDAMTGLANRRELEVQLSKVLSDADTGSSLIVVDLDGFKTINDVHGHLAGDEVLRAVAEELRRCVRQSDTVTRLGGDEFALLLPGCALSRAAGIAEQAREAIAALSIPWRGTLLGVTASVGVAPIAAGMGPLEALGSADAACYAAKGQGKNRVSTPSDAH